MIWPSNKTDLLELGAARMAAFCLNNNLSVPIVAVATNAEWNFSVCAYYRPKSGINICLDKCQIPCGEAESRNWTWPGSTTDREPYGVIAHELGHHADWTASDRKGTYYGDYSIKLRQESGEKPLTSYCENDAEWFAEIFRLFVTNPNLLQMVRPKTYELLSKRWKPATDDDWLVALGENVPTRVVRSLRNKFKP